MELVLLMLLTGTLAVMALIGSLAPAAVPMDGALSDLDRFIVDDASLAEAVPSLHRVEDQTIR